MVAAAIEGPPPEQPELKRVIGSRLLLFFVIGDILGTGIYALTGRVAGEVGGAAWMSFALSFVVALFTATSYVELVTKYPQAAGAALYTHRAFAIPFLTFLVAFTVMASGLTSASAGVEGVRRRLPRRVHHAAGAARRHRFHPGRGGGELPRRRRVGARPTSCSPASS